MRGRIALFILAVNRRKFLSGAHYGGVVSHCRSVHDTATAGVLRRFSPRPQQGKKSGRVGASGGIIQRRLTVFITGVLERRRHQAKR